MSQEDVEVVRASWDAWEREDMDALFALYDPTIVWDHTHHGPPELSCIYHGHEGVRRFFRDWLRPFESYRARAEQYVDARACPPRRGRHGVADV